jgi:hypothetical protein
MKSRFFISPPDDKVRLTICQAHFTYSIVPSLYYHDIAEAVSKRITIVKTPTTKAVIAAGVYAAVWKNGIRSPPAPIKTSSAPTNRVLLWYQGLLTTGTGTGCTVISSPYLIRSRAIVRQANPPGVHEGVHRGANVTWKKSNAKNITAKTIRTNLTVDIFSFLRMFGLG